MIFTILTVCQNYLAMTLYQSFDTWPTVTCIKFFIEIYYISRKPQKKKPDPRKNPDGTGNVMVRTEKGEKIVKSKL